MATSRYFKLDTFYCSQIMRIAYGFTKGESMEVKIIEKS